MTERFESCMCGESYLHVADLQFDDSGAFQDQCHIENDLLRIAALMYQ